MATVLNLRNTVLNEISGFRDVSTSAGSSTQTAVVNTVGSGTDIQWTLTAGGAAAEWITGRSPSGGWTLSGTVNVRLWAQESNVAANVGGRCKLFKRTSGGTVTQIATGDDGVEFTASNALYTWSLTPTSTAFAEDDRLIVRFYITNIGTMGGSRTATLSYNNSAANSADTSVTLTETITFKADPPPRTATLSSTQGVDSLSAFAGHQGTPQAWSTVAKSTTASLSNGDLTVIALTGGTNAPGRAVRPITEPTYFEAKLLAKSSSTASQGVGIANAAETYGAADSLGGASNNSLALYHNGQVWRGNAVVTTIATYTINDVVGVAVDPVNKRIWFRTNGGNWNNSGTANPATNTEGIDYSAVTSNVWPAYNVDYANTGGSFLANFGALQLAFTAPSGFTTFDAFAATGTLSVSQAGDTLAGTGKLLAQASSSLTQADQTVAGTGKLLAQASSSVAQDDQALAGSAIHFANGTLSVTQDEQGLSGTATLLAQGSVAASQAGDALSGTAALLGVGTLTASQAGDSVAGTAGLLSAGTLAGTQDAQTVAGVGGTPEVNGVLSIEQEGDALFAHGVPIASGIVTATQAENSAVILGTVVVQATATATQASQSVAGSGTVPASGSTLVSQAGDALSSTGTLLVVGSISAAQDGQALSGAAGLLASASMDAAQVGDSLFASSQRLGIGNLDVVQTDHALAAAGSSPVAASLSVAQDDDALSATGAAENSGELIVAQDADTLSAEGVQENDGELILSQAGDDLAAFATAPVSGFASVYQADNTLFAEGDDQVSVSPPRGVSLVAVDKSLVLSLSGRRRSGTVTGRAPASVLAVTSSRRGRTGVSGETKRGASVTGVRVNEGDD